MLEHLSHKFMFVPIVIVKQPISALLTLLFPADPLVKDFSQRCQFDRYNS